MHWYAARVRVPFEQRLADYLASRGVEVFLPIIKRRRLPPCVAFAGYIFTRLDFGVDSRQYIFRDGQPSCGFMGLVSFGGEPATIDDEVIGLLRDQMNEHNGIFDAGIAPKQLQQGQRVKVINGQFKHLHGIFQRETSHERVVLMMTIFNRSTSVVLDLADVALA